MILDVLPTIREISVIVLVQWRCNTSFTRSSSAANLSTLFLSMEVVPTITSLLIIAASILLISATFQTSRETFWTLTCSILETWWLPIKLSETTLIAVVSSALVSSITHLVSIILPMASVTFYHELPFPLWGRRIRKWVFPDNTYNS